MPTCAGWRRDWLEVSLATDSTADSPADLGPTLKADATRLLARLRTLARIGARPEGGVNRQAFTDGDIAARKLMLDWAAEIGLAPSTDAAGNLFLRLSAPGLDDRPPVLSGSHLDTQPAGGWLDGAYGVVAAVEALQRIRESGVALARPLEAVAWVNEEGCRFHPGLMGSTAFAGKGDIAAWSAQADDAGVTLADALAALKASSPDVSSRVPGRDLFAVVEAHIEQGPILESESATIGAVDAVQGLYWLQVTVDGMAGHAGTAPLAGRRDALLAAARMIAALSVALHDPDDVTRFTVGRIVAHPNSPNTVADRVTFTIDLRHPDLAELARCRRTIEDVCRAEAGPCGHRIAVSEHLEPVRFDAAVVAAVAAAARDLGHVPRPMVSGATHDAAVLAAIAPTAMIFVPCEEGLSHHPAENASDQVLAAGADVLATVLARLASQPG